MFHSSRHHHRSTASHKQVVPTSPGVLYTYMCVLATIIYRSIWSSPSVACLTTLNSLLSDEAMRVAVVHRLGCKACEPHTCVPGKAVSARGRGLHGPDVMSQECSNTSGPWLTERERYPMAGIQHSASPGGVKNASPADLGVHTNSLTLPAGSGAGPHPHFREFLVAKRF